MSADLAQVAFISLAWKYAQEHVNGEALTGLAIAAVRVRRQPVVFWRDLNSRLRSWNVTHSKSPDDAAILFDGIAGSLGCSVKWKQEVGCE